MNESGTIKELQRKDSYEIPENALREAALNAVVHRGYSIIGSDTNYGDFYRGKTENSTDKIQKITDKSTDKIVEKYGKLNNNEYKVIEYLMKNNSIKNKEVVEISELTSEGAKKLLQRLTKKQIISAIGAGKSRYYIL